VLDDDELADELAHGGLKLLGTVDETGRWVKAGLYSDT
jgi:hypothetical protein